MFQQRHFEAIARVMQRQYPDAALWDHQARRSQWELLRSAMADLFEQSNPRFDRARFMGACHPGANVRARSHKAA